MKIANHRLIDGEAVTFVGTANQSAGIRPLYLVIHDTAGLGLTGTVITLLLVHPIGCTDCAWRHSPAAVLVPSSLGGVFRIFG